MVKDKNNYIRNFLILVILVLLNINITNISNAAYKDFKEFNNAPQMTIKLIKINIQMLI